MTARATPARLAIALGGLLAHGDVLAQAVDDTRIADWIGRVDVPLPSGYRETAGTCIASADDPCAEAVSVLRDGQSHTHALLATRALRALDGSRPGGQRPLSLVTDALDVEALDIAGNELSVGLCERDGRADGRLVAVVRVDAALEWYVRFERLWRLDASGRLRAIAPGGVRCRNEGHGYDG